MKNRNAVTLIELLLAVSLLGMVMVVAANIDIAARNFYFRADRQGQLQLRLAVAMERMAKDISYAHGDINDPGIIVGGNSISVRKDIPASPENYADDTWVYYYQAGDRILSCSQLGSGFLPPDCASSSLETLVAANVTNLQFTPNPYKPTANLEIAITGTDALENPPISVTLHSIVHPRASSQN
jgi:type II secretory pathway pseudopilin PulG